MLTDYRVRFFLMSSKFSVEDFETLYKIPDSFDYSTLGQYIKLYEDEESETYLAELKKFDILLIPKNRFNTDDENKVSLFSKRYFKCTIFKRSQYLEKITPKVNRIACFSGKFTNILLSYSDPKVRIERPMYLTQYIPGIKLSEMLNIMKKNGNLLPQQYLFSILFSIAYVLSDLHSHDLAHLSLNADNIIIDQNVVPHLLKIEDAHQLHLIDFAKNKNDDKDSSTKEDHKNYNKDTLKKEQKNDDKDTSTEDHESDKKDTSSTKKEQKKQNKNYEKVNEFKQKEQRDKDNSNEDTTILASYFNKYNYLAPESDDPSVFSSESLFAIDTYAFGCLIYQIISKQEPSEKLVSEPNTNDSDMYRFYINYVKQGKNIFYNKNFDQDETEAAFLEIGKMCTAYDPFDRPSMQTVTKMISKGLKWKYQNSKLISECIIMTTDIDDYDLYAYYKTLTPCGVLESKTKEKFSFLGESIKPFGKKIIAENT